MSNTSVFEYDTGNDSPSSSADEAHRPTRQVSIDDGWDKHVDNELISFQEPVVSELPSLPEPVPSSRIASSRTRIPKGSAVGFPHSIKEETKREVQLINLLSQVPRDKQQAGTSVFADPLTLARARQPDTLYREQGFAFLNQSVWVLGIKSWSGVAVDFDKELRGHLGTPKVDDREWIDELTNIVRKYPLVARTLLRLHLPTAGFREQGVSPRDMEKLVRMPFAERYASVTKRGGSVSLPDVTPLAHDPAAQRRIINIAALSFIGSNFIEQIAGGKLLEVATGMLPNLRALGQSEYSWGEFLKSYHHTE